MQLKSGTAYFTITMAITTLTDKNFVLLGTHNKSLGINVSGYILVLFKMNDNNSREFEPVFVQLSRVDNRVGYAVIDINKYKNVSIQSRSTSTPITAVPILILYINGVPKGKFVGSKDVQSLRTFITKFLQAGNEPGQKQFVSAQRNVGNHGNGNNMYGEPQQLGNKKAYMPDIGSAPSLKGALKNGINMVEDDTHQELTVPDGVIPWNRPWETDESWK